MKYRDIIIGYGDDLNDYVLDSFFNSTEDRFYILVPKNLKVADGVLREVKKFDIKTLETDINISDYRVFMTPEKCNLYNLNTESVYKYIDRMLDEGSIIIGYTSNFDPINDIFNPTYEFYVLMPKDSKINKLQEIKENIDKLETLYVSGINQKEYKKYKIPGKYNNVNLDKVYDIIQHWIY